VDLADANLRKRTWIFFNFMKFMKILQLQFNHASPWT